MVDPSFLRNLPKRPGVYMMMDARNNVIYVGKAISLRNRVRSYFQSSRNLDPRIARMVEQVDRIEVIATRTELEALALENNLIKEHRPKYNVRMRDDKQYPWIKITTNENFPRVQVVRRPAKDGARYFGPYTDSGAMREIIRLLRRVFPIRSCNHTFDGKPLDRPCLNWHIGRCLGPCQGISEAVYQEMVNEICLFLSGRTKQLLTVLEEKMKKASLDLDFERAARFRDQIRDISRVVDKQRVVSAAGGDQDILAFALGEEASLVLVLLVRDGKVIGREHFDIERGISQEPGEILSSFVSQYYGDKDEFPPAILLPVELQDQEILGSWLQEKAGRTIRLTVPTQGEKKRLVQMAMENAQTLLAQEENRRQWHEAEYGSALRDLAEALNLPGPPRRIECFDISNTQGTEAVASMSVVEEGKPKGSEYRRFKIRTVEGPNDFAMLQEAVGRRFRRGLAERSEGMERTGKFAVFPDLLVIDGGKGQLSSVMEIMTELELTEIPTVGLAKENEEIFLPGRNEPVILPRESAALRLLQRVRDEAHRFGVTYHRSLRDKKAVVSSLDQIPGVGPKRKQALLRHFGSVSRIRRASLEELLQVEGMTEPVARAVLEGLSEEV